jgi:outer membrane murein-binding lipoprotein Lpp
MNSAANGLRFGVAFALGLLAAGPAMASNTDSAPSPQQAPDLQGKVLALEAQIEEMRQRMPAAQAEAGDNTQMPRTTYPPGGIRIR